VIRPRHRWQENVKVDLREAEWSDLEWIHLAEDREQWRALVNTTVNLRVSENVGTFLK
jgi:hypothetical protein